MKKLLLKSIYLWLICFYPLYGLKAQISVTRAEDYRDRYLWLQTANPAGWYSNSASPFFVADAGYWFTNGGMRTASEAALLHGFQISTESYRRFRKILVYGRLGYESSGQDHRQWQTTLQSEAHLIGFGDTVAGRQTIETYNICAGIALPLGKRWRIGAKMDYYARSGYKHVDPRNQNEQVDLSIAPGVLYHRETFGVGANFSYRRIHEKIDYSIFSGEVYNICSFYPLWFYTSETYQDANSSRTYQEERFGGALQLWGKGRQYEWLSEWTYAEGVETCDILPTLKSRAGETGREELNWRGQLRLYANVRHTFRPTYYRLVRVGYDQLQSMPEQSTGQSYLHFGKTKRSAVIDNRFSLDYTSLSCRDSLSGYRKINVRLEWQQEQTQFFLYPATFTQIITHIALATGYARQFRFRQGHSLEIGGEITYRHGGGHLPKFRAENEHPLPEIQIPQHDDLLIHDFQIRTAETLHYSADIQYTCHLKGSYAFFTRTVANCLQGLSGTYRTAKRFHCGISTGLLF